MCLPKKKEIETDPKAQTTLVEAARAAALAATGGDFNAARLLSARAPRANAWLTPACHPDPAPEEKHQLDWLGCSAVRALLRMRFGLPLRPRVGGCLGCRRLVADTLGVHTLSCTSGGGRTHVHHEIRDLVFAFASGGLLQPFREAIVPVNPRPGRLQPDLLFRAGARPLALDVAICNALAPSSCRAAASAETGAGAATEYEQKKILKYGAACAASGWDFAPLVVDTFGGWGALSLPVLLRVGRAWARALDLPARGATDYFLLLLLLLLR